MPLIACGSVSTTTVRRLFAEAELDKVSLRDGTGSKTRLKWQAEWPMASRSPDCATVVSLWPLQHPA